MRLFRAKSRNKDINELIFDVAENGRESDVDEVYARLKHLDLYTSVISANFDCPAGESVMIRAGMDLRIPTAKIGGLELVLFFINKDDARLRSRFIRMSVAEALDMVERTDHSDGIVFYNNRVSYFGILRQDFGWVRDKYLRNELGTRG